MSRRPPESLRRYQRQLAGFLRSGEIHDKQPAIADRPAQIYAHLLFNNIRGFTDKCFPVCKSILGETEWLKLNRAFFRDWPCKSPFFSAIPGEFVAYLASGEASDELPQWLDELAHYEWLELVAETHPATYHPCEGKFPLECGVDTLQVSVNPSLRLGVYSWPVHHISPKYIPPPRATFLVVYRDRNFQVRFMELNQLTAALIEWLGDHPGPFSAALAQLQPLLKGLQPAALREHLLETCQTLLEKDVLGLPGVV